jgi:hypothetical protein
MACCVAVVYLFSVAWRGIRWMGRLGATLTGSARPPETHRFAPAARREVRLPAGAPTS